jgi:hypothetical protein
LSIITIGKIKEMVEKGYLMEGEGCVPGTEMKPEPDSDEAVVSEDFFLLLVYACRRIHFG